jgi:putative acyl-CoA dehydrogenase
MQRLLSRAKNSRFVVISQVRLSHTVFNQSNPLVDIDVFSSDPAMKDCVSIFGATDIDHLKKFGVKTGEASLMHAAETAEKNRPVLRQFDNYGRRIDIIDYHDSYHKIMSHAIENGVVSHGFKNGNPGDQITRVALAYMENQLEPGKSLEVYGHS